MGRGGIAVLKDQKNSFLNVISRRDFIVKSAAAGAIVMMSRHARAEAAEPYRLGLLLSTTGSGANYSEGGIKAVTNAVAEINARGGLLGKHQIEIHFRDTQSKPDSAAREARDVITRDNVRAVIGTWSSAEALAVEEIIDEHKVLHFAANSNSSRLTHENFSPWFFQYSPDTRMESGAIAVVLAEMARKNNWKSFVSIGQDYEWARAQQAGFLEAFNKLVPDVKLSKEFWFKIGETSFGPYISGIMAMKPDFCFGAIAGKDNVTFIEQARPAGLFKRTVYPGGLLSLSELQQLKDALPRGMIGVARAPFYALLDQPVMQKYLKMYHAAYGADAYPSDWACMHYDAVYGLEQAVTKAGSIENEDVRKALTGATIDTCRGKATFRACNNQLGVPSYVGTVTDSPDYKFPILDPKTMTKVSAEQTWLPSCEEVQALQKKRA
jgi:branched-chain amino acid transport system substrate-binding protein